MEEARAAFEPEPQPALRGATTADVVILGGGYTGMWTAWFLKERDPSCDIVLLEGDELCGSGPSGRNGGFCYGVWEDLETLVRFFGDDDALRVAHTAHRSVGEIEAWLDAQRCRRVVHARRASDDRDRRPRRTAPGTRWSPRRGASASPTGGSWSSTPARCAPAATPPCSGRGLLQPDNAILQPARLALGLRAALLARGVRDPRVQSRSAGSRKDRPSRSRRATAAW